MNRFIYRLLRRLGLLRPERLTFNLELEDRLALRELARQEKRRPDDVAADLLAAALERRRIAGEYLGVWHSLTAREQEVAALICLGYTTKQMAARLQISTETVNTHVYNGLRKFGLHRRTELQRLLGDWDFSSWVQDSK